MLAHGKELSLIHHSDRGLQYASRKYTGLLKANNIRISITESGNPKENPQAERVNGTTKNEILSGRKFYSHKGVRDAVDEAVSFYNSERPHMSIGMMTPEETADTSGERDMKWTSYRERAIKRLKSESIHKNALSSDFCNETCSTSSNPCSLVNPFQG